MAWFGSLFGGRALEEKLVTPVHKFEVNAKHEADEQAENTARATELFERALGNDPENCSTDRRRWAAVTLVLTNETAKGREAWLAIARDYPSELADALEQVGVCYHLEKDYQSALENYEAAIRVGASAERMVENMAEARKGLAAFR